MLLQVHVKRAGLGVCLHDVDVAVKYYLSSSSLVHRLHVSGVQSGTLIAQQFPQTL
jgi:hypothetical protein